MRWVDLQGRRYYPDCFPPTGVGIRYADLDTSDPSAPSLAEFLEAHGENVTRCSPQEFMEWMWRGVVMEFVLGTEEN